MFKLLKPYVDTSINKHAQITLIPSHVKYGI